MSPESDYENIHIETTLPKSWEEEVTFNDILYDWMSRAPWLAISAAAHVIIFMIMTIIPWSLIFQKEETVLQASIQQAPEEVFEDPPEEEPEEIEEEEGDVAEARHPPGAGRRGRVRLLVGIALLALGPEDQEDPERQLEAEDQEEDPGEVVDPLVGEEADDDARAQEEADLKAREEPLEALGERDERRFSHGRA